MKKIFKNLHGSGFAQLINNTKPNIFQKSLQKFASSSSLLSRKLYVEADRLSPEILEFFYGPACNLDRSFQSWFSITQLHLWIFMTKARLDPEKGKEIAKGLVNHLTTDLELKLYGAGVINMVQYERTLKELISAHTGCSLAYDEGYVKGDSLLANALWRNVWGM